MALLHPSQKSPKWKPPEQLQCGTLLRTTWEIGLSSQQVRMGFAHAFGFMTPKEVEFLSGKRYRRSLLKKKKKTTLKSQKLGLNNNKKVVLE